MNLGYACINQTLSDQKITVNRSMIRKTFDTKGLPYASELIVKNLTDLAEIIHWNYRHNIFLYRMSSDMFPWMSEYQLEQLPDFKQINTLLTEIGKLVKRYKQRISFHPGPFNVLASLKENVVINTIKDLDQHARIMDLMGLDASPYYKINIHVGTTQGGEKEKALRLFCENFMRLGESTRKRLTIENDDKPGMFTTQDLYNHVHLHIGIPVVFDYHHHWCNPGGLTEEEALLLAIESWKPSGIKPAVHYSEPRSLEDKAQVRAHADYISQKINTHGQDIDIMVEAKAKELAVLNYLKLHAGGE
jgi:UV DNA damage endonuclease